MSDYEAPPPEDADRVVPPFEESSDPEAPAKDINREEPMPDGDRHVQPDFEDPTSDDDGLATEEINPPDAGPVRADREELAKDNPHFQQENAETSQEQPSENVE